MTEAEVWQHMVKSTHLGFFFFLPKPTLILGLFFKNDVSNLVHNLM